MTLFTLEDEVWLADSFKETIKALSATQLGWEGARLELENIFWIRGIHDEMGERVYTRLMIKRGYEEEGSED